MEYTDSVMQGAGAADDNMPDYYDKESPDFNYKVILVGHARVGKTSMINRFINEGFNEHEKSTKTV